MMVQLPEVQPRTVRPTERSPRAQTPDAQSRGTRDNVVRLCHVKPAHVPLRHAAPSPPQLPDLLHRLAKKNRADHPISYLNTLIKGSESIETTLRRRRILFAEFVARTEDTRLPKYVMFGELVRGAGCARGCRKRVDGVFPGQLQELSVSRSTSARLQSRTRGNGARRRKKGRNVAKWITAEKVRDGLRHEVISPNATGRAIDRIAQSKSILTGSLAIVDYV